MIVFRLETRKGQGVYGRGFGFKFSKAGLMERAGEAVEGPVTKHIGPDQDPLLKVWWDGKKLSKKAQFAWVTERRDWYCGFSSLDQLKEWFPKEGIEGMMKADEKSEDSMMLVVYEVKPKFVKNGEAQVLFNMEEARVVEKMGLDELHSMYSVG